jgi:hypothetical protein
VPLIDSGEVDGVPFLVMRLIEGASLRQLIRHDPPTPELAVDLLTGIGAALDFAHARGALHRDIKPQNILVDGEDHAWLVDFGLTTLGAGEPGSDAGPGRRVAGSFDYLAPEIARGEPASVSGDIYALAVTAFQTLTGRLPVDRDGGPEAAGTQAVSRPPAASEFAPGLPPEVDAVLADGMAVDPADRPASAGEFIARLRRALGLSPRTSREVPRASGAPVREDAPTVVLGQRRRQPGGRALLGAALLGCAGVAAVVLILASGGSRPGGTFSADSGLHPETARAATGTWFDYGHADVRAGAAVHAGTRLSVTCRVRGQAVRGNRWWYRLASDPWQNSFYAPASAFRAGAGPGTAGYDPGVPVCDVWPEYPGNPGRGTYTWTDYRTSSGDPGEKLVGYQPADVLCRVKGLRVPDGDVWWYRIAGSPWHGRFFASADAFYNNGESRGSLKGTAFVDPDVPLCALGTGSS